MLTDSEILRRTQRRATFRVVPTTDWRAILRTRANVLITGPTAALSAFAAMARSEMREPIRSAGPALPALLGGAQTLILTDVDALDRDSQQRLARWLDRQPGAQVVALSSTNLFALVTKNAFDRDLYYRLNTVLLDIESA